MPENSNQSKFDNYSLDFNGTDEYILIDPILKNLPSDNFTISAWVKINTLPTGTAEKVLFQELTSASRYVRLCIKGNQNGFVLRYGNGSNLQINGATTITTDVWYNIMLVYSTTGIKLYLNGSEDASASYTALSRSAFVDAAIGCYYYASSASSFWDGEINDFSLFDYALSTDQINYLYNSGTPQNPMAISGNAPVAYYPLGGGSTGDAAVSSPNTLTVPNESVPSATVFHFDDTPSNNLINLGVQSSIENSTSFTLNFWLNPSSFTSPYTLLGTKTGFSGDSAKGIAFDVRSTFLIIYLGDDFSNYARVNNPLPLNEWTLLSVVYDGSQSTNADKFKIYYGSTQQTVNTFGGTIPSTSPTTGRSLILGKQATGNCIETDVSNLTIFSSALQGSDITTLYNNGSPLKNIPSGTLTNDLTAWYKLNVDTSTWNGSNWIIGNSTANYTTALDFVQSETDYIELDNVVNLGTTWTISFWINTTQGLSSSATILAAGSGNGFTMLLLRNNRLMLYRGAGADYNYFLTNGEFNDGEWHNIILVRNGTKDIIPYLDGNIGSYYFAAGSGNLDTNMKFIGDDGGTWGTATAFDGALSNIAFFDTACKCC
jgi:hypothetical protein